MIHTLNRRADSHQNFCEDALYYTERDGWIIAAVFDGCSDGINSHFASQLMHYILRGVLRDNWNSWFQLMTRTELTPQGALNRICVSMWDGLCAAKRNLPLEELEILSTMVLVMYHVRREYLAVKFIGDGLLLVNGEAITRIDSGPTNQPAYLAYVAEEDCHNDWFAANYPEFVFTNVKEWSICTDGIDQIKYKPQGLSALDYLLKDKSLLVSSRMLGRKINILQNNGAVLNDDVTIIRYTNEIV